MSRPHATKPFPVGFYDNAKLKKQHLFIFDVLCRHLDADADNWIRTDSKTIVGLLKKTSGIVVQTPKQHLHSLKEYGYITMTEREARTAYERVHNISLFEIQILDSAWEAKGIVRPYEPQDRREYMNKRNAKRKEIQDQIKALLEQED